jgi:hypothetical protein
MASDSSDENSFPGKYYDSALNRFFEFSGDRLFDESKNRAPESFRISDSMFLVWFSCILDVYFTDLDLTPVFSPDDGGAPVLSTPNAFDPESHRCRLILIAGSRTPITGVWSVAASVFNSLRGGTVIPFVEQAQNREMEVIVINPNHPNAHKIPLRSPNEIVMNLFTDFIFEQYLVGITAPIYIVAHGLAAESVRYTIEHQFEWAASNVGAIAFGDGCFDESKSSQTVRLFKERAVNWAQSSAPINRVISEPQDDPDDYTIRTVSAGTNDHSQVLAFACDAIWEFFQERGAPQVQ